MTNISDYDPSDVYARLICQNSDNIPLYFNKSITFGYDSDICMNNQKINICLNDQKNYKKHFMLHFFEGCFFLTNFFKNGTSINSVKITDEEPKKMNNGDRIDILQTNEKSITYIFEFKKKCRILPKSFEKTSPKSARKTRSCDSPSRQNDGGNLQTKSVESTSSCIESTLSAPASAPTHVSSAPAPKSSAPTPVSSAPTHVSSAPTPVSSAPAPVSSAPAPVSSAPTPVSSAPAPVSSAPAPVSSAPTPVSSAPTPVSSAPTPTASQSDFVNKMAEQFTCPICFDIMHKCVSVSPCLHNMCSACMYDFQMSSGSNRSCPVCRENIDHTHRNHPMSSVIESFIQSHPHRARIASEIEELNKKDKLWEQVDFKKKKKIEENISSDDSDMTDSDDGCDCCSPNCDPIDGFQCPTRNSRNHTYCHECGDCLPLRLDLLQDRKINCDICGLNYCTPYRTSCPAQINSVNLLNTIWIIKLKDAKLGSILTSKWLLNSAERGIYDAYLSSNSTTIQDIYNNSISQNKGVLNTPYFRNLMQIKNLRIVPNNEILGYKIRIILNNKIFRL
eukprot:GHVL01025575.1.p1 GENE.GHVL01025575.1~~GHVL01025575.1.p1  ORF type:complete len:570 (+),score=127.24 GHVL01025575.1:26-1711(+)